VVKDSETILEVVTPWSLSTHGYCSQWSAGSMTAAFTSQKLT